MTPPPSSPPSLRTTAAIQEQVEKLFGDGLLLPNSPARARILTGALMLALRVLETSELEQRIAALETRAQMRAA